MRKTAADNVHDSRRAIYRLHHRHFGRSVCIACSQLSWRHHDVTQSLRALDGFCGYAVSSRFRVARYRMQLTSDFAASSYRNRNTPCKPFAEQINDDDDDDEPWAIKKRANQYSLII